MLVTRFAPSPTGSLHLGHAFAAIVAHDFARAAGGRFLLRIEDLDRTRSRPDFEASALADLKWLGLSWDSAPIHQSARTLLYAEALSKLESLGVLYRCFCSRKDIAAAIDAPHEPAETIYPGTCRHLSAGDQERRASATGIDYAIRLNTTRAAELTSSIDIAFTECLALEKPPRRIPAQPNMLGDVVLSRKGNVAAYHLAVVVDDATHIHVLLQALLGLATPLYAHHALVRDEYGARLAKRDNAHALSQLRSAGWTPEDVRHALPSSPNYARLLRAALTNY